jgi:hypothetical protein
MASREKFEFITYTAADLDKRTENEKIAEKVINFRKRSHGISKSKAIDKLIGDNNKNKRTIYRLIRKIEKIQN